MTTSKPRLRQDKSGNWAVVSGRRPMKIRTAVVSKSAAQPTGREVKAYVPPHGVIPPAEKQRVNKIAQDAVTMANDYAGSLDTIGFGYGQFDYYFPGYPALATLAQLPEYRKMSETIAEEMTRKWIRLTAKGDEDKSDKISEIEEFLEKHKIKTKFRRCAELDGFFGRGQLYIDVKDSAGTSVRANPEELASNLLMSPKKIGKDAVIGFTVVEPVWTYPGSYNSNDPLAPDFYRPTTWYVMGKTVHQSRLLNFVSREVPDLLKASYNFGGLSLSQIAQPYVNNWLRTRDSVSDTVHNFSVSILKTDLSAVLSGGDDADMNKRAALFNNLRDNRNMMLLDKDGEEYDQVNTPLSGMSDLQAQSQEQLSSISSIPLVKFWGITPSGLNASSDGEIHVFYDHINSRQESLFRDNLETVIKIAQLHLHGEIDPDIGFEFETLHDTDQVEEATVRKTDAETAQIYVAMGSLSPDEPRERLAKDETSGYSNIDLNDIPDVADPLDDFELEDADS